MKIALDAGHGMKTAGKRCLKSIDPNETREWWLNQRIATKVENKLKEYENVETLRVDDVSGDIDVKLGTRCKLANDWKADIYCSFHHNAGINGSDKPNVTDGGLVVITYDDSDEAVNLRNALYDSLINAGLMNGNRSNPKVSNKNLYVLNSTKMMAVLVEHGFMDSPDETPVILTEEFAEKAANGWIDFFEKYYGIKKKTDAPKEEPKEQPKEEPKAEGYFVRVKSSALNIRDKAGYIGKVTGIIRDKGIYTIVAEQNVNGIIWGKLKSGAGWISLKYTERV
jgi:N-acetylmuramoyl-L-alanine amidase